jgi:hypothetical protein
MTPDQQSDPVQGGYPDIAWACLASILCRLAQLFGQRLDWLPSLRGVGEFELTHRSVS